MSITQPCPSLYRKQGRGDALWAACVHAAGVGSSSTGRPPTCNTASIGTLMAKVAEKTVVVAVDFYR